MLTKKQLDLLEFIHKRVQRDGVPPSFDEMKEALDLRSKSGIHRLITALEERGFIRRLAHRARALEIVKLPDALQAKLGGTPAPSGFEPRVIDGDRPDSRPSNAQPLDGGAIELPVMGRIAANGDIVVALVEDAEATLKRYRRNGNAIALEAANPAYETRLFRDDQVKVQGRLVGLIRTY